MNPSRVLIKLGGAALDFGKTISQLAEALRFLQSQGQEIVIVHGGGPAINAELTRRAITWTFVNGQRVTTPQMIEVIESTLCGVVNRKLVRQLGAAGFATIGFSGVDRRTLQCSPSSPELGLVGKIDRVDGAWIEILMAQALLPVIAPLGVGVQGECFNINADWAATSLAVGLGVRELIFLTDQPGIFDEEGQVIGNVDAAGLHNMIDCRTVTGGMLAKAQAILHALEHGVPRVRVLKGDTAAQGIQNLAVGTTCRPHLQPSPMPAGPYEHATV